MLHIDEVTYRLELQQLQDLRPGIFDFDVRADSRVGDSNEMRTAGWGNTPRRLPLVRSRMGQGLAVNAH
ncbi:hypothetical protein SCLCIDRAFT_1207468 [Scleroderma citrinum Foug A]|uniref:Uncharacterized protein n=1 Tax=Scleroderma citrinum Foug A TaxID=1036808 RepID=A0A0C3EQU3_9AGAM|nr:hypothetical protein SCLCIDRAFT_1207468 [Scleroderma citrinum Foug A]